MAVQATETDEILAGMFTENTGSHFLDSGGAYGRNHERNRGRTVDDFLAAPEVRLEHGYVSVDAFHWLRERVEFDPTMDRKLRLWDALFGEGKSWLEIMEEFAEAHRNKGGRGRGYLDGTFNTYNGEDSLSQTLQFTIFTDPEWGDDEYVLLQVHGGCDVRGGYTAPRAFRVAAESSDMLDWDTYTLVCTAEERGEPLPGMPEADQHILDRRNGEWTTYEGSFVSDPWNGDEGLVEKDGETHIRCPWHIEPTPMALYPAVVS